VADHTGYVEGNSITGSLKVYGSLVGSADYSDAGVINYQSAKNINITGNIQGGDATMSSVKNSGTVLVAGKLDSMVLGGSLIAGAGFDNTDINLGSIRAGSIGSLTIKGDVIGNALQHALITGQGDITATKGKNLAINTLTVNGKVSYADILGGYDTLDSAINGAGGNDGGSAQLGTITVKGSWANSSIATGAQQATGVWGAGNNTALSKPAGSTIAATIAKVVLNGPATSPNIVTGIVAQNVLGLVLAGFNVSPITDGLQVDSSANFHVELV